MKRLICLTILLLLITVPSFADDTIKELCDTHVCLVSFDFGYNFGFGGGSSSGGSGGILLEDGTSFLLTEDSKYLIQE